MKRLVTLAVLSAFILGGMAYATETRVLTMGDVNNIVKDEANIWLYPSTINYYPKLFIGEADYGNYWKVGGHFVFGENGDKPMVLGAYFSQEDDYFPSILNYPDKAVPYADQRLTLFYGRELSDMPFGFFLNYYTRGSKNEDTATSSNNEESLSRYEFAFGLSPMQKKLDLTVGFAFTTWKDKDYYNAALGIVDLSKPVGNLDLGIMARYWMDPMGNYTLVPHGGLMYSKQGVDYYDYDGTSWVAFERDETKDMMLDLGLGMNYDAAENVLVVGDIGFQLDNYKETYDYAAADVTDPDDYKDNVFILPYFKIGIDAEVFNWMDFRSGVNKYWAKETYEPDAANKEISTRTYTYTYLGAGFNWGNFTIDAQINTNFLETGPYFISGQSDEYNNLAEQVTLKYAF
jgi:hypothetical protein